jgi:RNA polymerase sigma factor (TIGR02999 family)
VPQSSVSHATQLITRLAGGDVAVAGELFPLVYAKLRGLAGAMLQEERADHTLQPTALVHEAYLRMADVDSIDWRGRAHFCAIAARAMRQVLVDHARTKKALKRGQGWQRVTLSNLVGGPDSSSEQVEVDLVKLDEALTRFAKQHPRQAKAVEMRFFAKMTGQEIADVVGVSRRTVTADLAFAEAWLMRDMTIEASEASEDQVT